MNRRVPIYVNHDGPKPKDDGKDLLIDYCRSAVTPFDILERFRNRGSATANKVIMDDILPLLENRFSFLVNDFIDATDRHNRILKYVRRKLYDLEQERNMAVRKLKHFRKTDQVSVIRKDISTAGDEAKKTLSNSEKQSSFSAKQSNGCKGSISSCRLCSEFGSVAAGVKRISPPVGYALVKGQAIYCSGSFVDPGPHSPFFFLSFLFTTWTTSSVSNPQITSIGNFDAKSEALS